MTSRLSWFRANPEQLEAYACAHRQAREEIWHPAQGVYHLRSQIDELDELLGGGIKSSEITALHGDEIDGTISLGHTLCVASVVGQFSPDTGQIQLGRAALLSARTTPPPFGVIARRFGRLEEVIMQVEEAIQLLCVHDLATLLDAIFTLDGLFEAATEIPWRLIVIESMNGLINETRRDEVHSWRFAFAALRELSARFNVAVVIGHHPEYASYPSFAKAADYWHADTNVLIRQLQAHVRPVLTQSRAAQLLHAGEPRFADGEPRLLDPSRGAEFLLCEYGAVPVGFDVEALMQSRHESNAAGGQDADADGDEERLEEECPICYERPLAREKCMLHGESHHWVCLTCARKLMLRSTTECERCPICRQELEDVPVETVRMVLGLQRGPPPVLAGGRGLGSCRAGDATPGECGGVQSGGESGGCP